MFKKLLFSLATIAITTTSFSQIDITYEKETPQYGSIGSNNGVTIHEIITNDESHGLNTTTHVGRITETVGAQNWDFANFSNPGFALNPTNGLYIGFLVLSKNETTFTIKVETRHWINDLATNMTNSVEKTLTVALNTWTYVEFDFSSETYIDNWCNRLGVQFNSANGNRDGDVYYIDEIVQYTATLNTDSNTLHENTTVYPNPTKGEVFISDLKGAETITVTNLLGKTIKVVPATNSLDLYDVVPGVYIIQTDNGLQRKIVKQ